jgi:hypothetical protein
MKKLFVSIGLSVMATVAFAQSGWVVTNFPAVTAGGGHSSLVGTTNYWKLFTPANTVVEVDSITAQLVDVPSSGWTNTLPVKFYLHDNWTATNRWKVSTTDATASEHTFTNYSGYATNYITVACPGGVTDPGAPGAHFTNYLTAGVYTNWFTNSAWFTLPVATTWTNLFTPTPSGQVKKTWQQSPSTTVTHNDLGIICTKGGVFGWVVDGGARIETNTVNVSIKYRTLFGPNRP